jgi:phage baseplate assembly protein W
MLNNPKIFESPDGGKTIYQRDFGSSIREKILHPQELLTKKILPIDVFYKLFGKQNES